MGVLSLTYSRPNSRATRYRASSHQTAAPGCVTLRRRLGHAVGTDKDSSGAAEGAFQQYTTELERMACSIPDSMPFQDAAVLPLAVSTAACGRFQSDQLGLRHPSANPEPTGQTVLVWAARPPTVATPSSSRSQPATR